MSNKKINYSLPSGFPEYLPGEKRLEKSIIQDISEVFECYGFTPIETPAVERTEVLMARNQQGDNIIYTIAPHLPEDSSDTSESASNSRGLKFDQTVPLSAYIARHLNKITFPFFRYQMDMVFRGERAKDGRSRQFRQCDIDVVGRGKLSLIYDAQMPAIIAEIFDRLGIGDFLIRINNRKILTGFFQAHGVTTEMVKRCIKIVDDMDKMGELKVLSNLEALGLSTDQAQQILGFTKITGSIDEIFAQLQTQASAMGHPDDFCQGITELQTVIDGVRALRVPVHRYCIDLSIARGLGYYTGTVYETTLLAYKNLGSICSGGRYEDLVGTFVGEKMPGVGISIGLTRLMTALLKSDSGVLQPLAASPAQVNICYLNPELMDTYLGLAQELRQAGINVLNSFEERPIGKHFDHAHRLGIPLVVLIDRHDFPADQLGERSLGQARLKILGTGEDRKVPLDHLIAEIQQELSHHYL